MIQTAHLKSYLLQSMNRQQDKVEQLVIEQVNEKLALPSPPLIAQLSFNSKNLSTMKNSQDPGRPPINKKNGALSHTKKQQIRHGQPPLATTMLKTQSKQHQTVKNQNLRSTDTHELLSRVRSDHKIARARESTVSQEKRMRLREYLFTAKKSLQKNREKRNQIRRKSPQGSEIQASMISELRKHKYYLPNEQIHKVVQKSIVEDLTDIIASLKDNLQFIQSQDNEEISKQDLAFFYEVRKMISAQLQPAVQNLRMQKAKRQRFVLEGIFSLGKNLVQSKEQYINADIPVKKTVSKLEMDVTESMVMDRRR